MSLIAAYTIAPAPNQIACQHQERIGFLQIDFTITDSPPVMSTHNAIQPRLEPTYRKHNQVATATILSLTHSTTRCRFSSLSGLIGDSN